jgi:hypothetical protein
MSTIDAQRVAEVMRANKCMARNFKTLAEFDEWAHRVVANEHKRAMREADDAAVDLAVDERANDLASDKGKRHKRTYRPKHPTPEDPDPNSGFLDDEDEESRVSARRVLWPDVERAALDRQVSRLARDVKTEPEPVRLTSAEKKQARALNISEAALLANKARLLTSQAEADAADAKVDKAAASPKLTAAEKKMADRMGISHDAMVITKAKKLQRKGA